MYGREAESNLWLSADRNVLQQMLADACSCCANNKRWKPVQHNLAFTQTDVIMNTGLGAGAERLCVMRYLQEQDQVQFAVGDIGSLVSEGAGAQGVSERVVDTSLGGHLSNRMRVACCQLLPTSSPSSSRTQHAMSMSSYMAPKALKESYLAYTCHSWVDNTSLLDTQNALCAHERQALGRKIRLSGTS